MAGPIVSDDPEPMRIGPHALPSPLLLAPMAGITDRPFRVLCRRMGAGLAFSEMVSTNPRLRGTPKSRHRLDTTGEPGPIAVQIAGTDPEQMATAARYHREQGADIIDINMGCPAKKVCRKAAGAALMRDEVLVGRILDAVVAATDGPVMLKMRTGWDRDHRNAVAIARLAAAAGVSALTIHGRSRADGYDGPVEFDTVRRVRDTVDLPLIANGDIIDADSARQTLASTGADGLMIGRGAQGDPWIFQRLGRALGYLPDGQEPDRDQRHLEIRNHIHAIHAHYGTDIGVRVARKHIRWYLARLAEGLEAPQELLRESEPAAQFQHLDMILASYPQQEHAA
ncbi:MAG: tRNA dihydrouridine synthase DusB [Pseudomonadota bacterium]